jgi:hypothetical protein
MMPHEDGHWETSEADRDGYWSPPPLQRFPIFRRPTYYDPGYQQYEYHPPSFSHPTVYPLPTSAWYEPPHPHQPVSRETTFDHPRLPDPVVNLHSRPHGAHAQQQLIYEVRDTDVLCGRGAPTNWHPGNQYFRRLVDRYQPVYLACKRADKPEIAVQVVDKIRERGGRFLKRTKMPGVGPSGHFCWQDIGEQRAYEKSCQALREGAPELRKSRMAIKDLSAVSLDSQSEQGAGETP